ncbi:MAG: Gfo/Idh/MocA family oxidoreductase [Lewinellaceae bacterium]|jgi:predicted dehydrogenase|nr:Gfo/Idh/MocA family oxidoreductase [Lewinellaceae bacterium]
MAKLNRRSFLRDTTLAGAALVTSGIAGAEQTAPVLRSQPSSPQKDKLRIGFIGTGLRGQNHVEEALLRSDCEVAAIADPDPRMVADCLQLISEKGGKKPAVYDRGNFDYQRLLQDKDIDAVVIASPWEWHTQQCVAAMQAGKYTGTEVCGGFSLDECWQLVNTHESTGAHLMFLENVCYRRDVMAVLQMVREGLFGELMHLEGGYQHDLRGVKFNDGITPYDSGVEFGEKGFSEAKWRTKHAVHRNGDLYPTHGVGPVAMMTNINRGNRFLHLTATSSKARGLHEYVVNHPKGGPDHPNAKVQFNLGDVVTTVIRTSNGETVLLSHDTGLPRPYSLGFRVQGTKGIWMDVNQSLLLDGKTKPHAWENAQSWLDQYDHPLWRRFGADAKAAGHGGMDFFVFHHFVECAKRNIAPQIDVYDAATWLAITPLSEASIATGSSPQAFPDFTRGRWTERKPDFAFGDTF